MTLLEPIQGLMRHFTDVAYMTGGYRGESGDNYGVTRAGFDVPKAQDKETLVIMCAAGIKDAHQTAAAMSIYGDQWGDDTPGLSEVSDAAVFIRNFPNGQVYGKWTEVEIANFVHRGKPLVIFDPQASVTSETKFGAKVPVCKNAYEVAEYLNMKLPTPETVKELPPVDVGSAPAGPVQQQHENYMAVRLYYDSSHEYARWVRSEWNEGRDPFKNVNLNFSDSPAVVANERDLVLDGYWKDIMLLQTLRKLPDSGDLARGYARQRKELEQQIKPEEPPPNWWTLMQSRAIDGIWFMFSAEHDIDAFEKLEALPKDPYDRKVQELAGG